jgi:hypothetical protein
MAAQGPSALRSLGYVPVVPPFPARMSSKVRQCDTPSQISSADCLVPWTTIRGTQYTACCSVAIPRAASSCPPLVARAQSVTRVPSSITRSGGRLKYSMAVGLFRCIQRKSSLRQVKRPGRSARAMVDLPRKKVVSLPTKSGALLNDSGRRRRSGRVALVTSAAGDALRRGRRQSHSPRSLMNFSHVVRNFSHSAIASSASSRCEKNW